MNRFSVTRGAAVGVVTVLAAVGLLAGSGAANAASGGAGAVDAVPASAATCAAWNLSNDLVYVYSDD